MPLFESSRAVKLIQQNAVNLNCGCFKGFTFFIHPVYKKVDFFKLFAIYCINLTSLNSAFCSDKKKLHHASNNGLTKYEPKRVT